MNKSLIITSLVEELRKRLDRAVTAYDGARDGATSAESRAEHKYDTRGLESSYLAAGLAEKIEDMRRELHAVEICSFREFDLDDPVGLGALVEVEQGGSSVWYLLAPGGGGITLTDEDGCMVTVISPTSPLASALTGMTVGSVTSDPSLTLLEVF